MFTHRGWATCVGAALLSMACISGCSLLGEDCGSCGSNLWPSLILGTPTEAGVESVTIKEETSTRQAVAGTCPPQFTLRGHHLCSWSHTTSFTSTVIVAAKTPDGLLVTSVELKREACAEDVAYVELQPTEDGKWQWGEVEYSDPCLGLE